MPNQFLPTQLVQTGNNITKKIKTAITKNTSNNYINKIFLDNIYVYGANIGMTLSKPNLAARKAYRKEPPAPGQNLKKGSKVFSNAIFLQKCFQIVSFLV